ncbi:hypothetical protein N7452_005417 [Penicillium brevicompactum]|uniref:Uncharacterized protein n=1 Tax=Penicillium brevicompactum TaxID=5074 RepID=A0A9W9UFP7_PENBR|nr:hypothetical protein N7452_005417 [Penicillium brevicompactum]
MRTQFFIAAFLASLAQADDASSSIRGYFSPDWKAGWNGAWTSTAASIAGINAEATTYHVGCVKDAPKSACDLVDSITIIQGAETASFNAKYIATSSGTDGWDLTVTETWDCSLVSTTESASCTMSISAGGSAYGGKTSSSSSTSATYTTAPMNEKYYSLTVTGGLESFTAPAATKTPDAAAAGPAAALITAAPMVAAAVAALL